jgi:hypothetical protein
MPASRRSVLAIALLAAVLVPAAARAAGPGQYGPPEWLPLRFSAFDGDFTVGCVFSNCTVSGAPYHNYWAIDILDGSGRPGAPVYAAGAGRVISVDASHTACGPQGTPANFVNVDHGNGTYSRYVHMATIQVAVGQWVDENTKIGTVGAVGYTFPCPLYHLHFEVVSFTTGRLEPPALKACHLGTVVSYPSSLGFGQWNSVPPFRYGVWSDGTSCVTKVPGVPLRPAAVAGSGQASVSFDPPDSDGGAPIGAYTVTASPGGATATGGGSPIVVTGLANGTAYTFTVRATNAVGTGSATLATSPVTPRSLPAAPSGVTATAGDGSATVSFTAPGPVDSSTLPIRYYTVTASPGGRSASGSGAPITVFGLDNGTSYTFTATATNATGTGAASGPSDPVVPEGEPRPHPDPPAEAPRPVTPDLVAPAAQRPPRPAH